MTIFYADGHVIFQKSSETLQDDGTISVTFGFPVCEICAFVEDRDTVAIKVAELLSSHYVD